MNEKIPENITNSDTSPRDREAAEQELDSQTMYNHGHFNNVMIEEAVKDAANWRNGIMEKEGKRNQALREGRVDDVERYNEVIRLYEDRIEKLKNKIKKQNPKLLKVFEVQQNPDQN